MNRDQLIEKAARASHQHGLDCGAEYAQWDDLRESVRREYREDAAAILDAILPQVSTVEELVQLPHYTLLVTEDGREVRWSWRAPEPLGTAARLLLRVFGPLTVVWQPCT